MSSPYETLDRKTFQERAERLKRLLPATVEPPDDIYLNGDAFSWEFAVDGHRATHNFMVAGARRDFPPSEVNQIITFINQVKKTELDDDLDADLIVEFIDGERRSRTQAHMRREGDRVQGLEGFGFRIISGDVMIEYVIEYPGEKPLVEDFRPELSSE